MLFGLEDWTVIMGAGGAADSVEDRREGRWERRRSVQTISSAPVPPWVRNTRADPHPCLQETTLQISCIYTEGR